MSLQTWSHIIIAVGILFTAAGGFGSYYFGKLEAEQKENDSTKEKIELNSQINDLQNKLSTIQFYASSLPSINQKVEQILYESIASKGAWEEIKTIEIASWLPIGVQHYFLLFKADAGTIRGRIRAKGSKDLYSFSTNVNDKMPLAIHNLWMPDMNQYQHFPIIEHQIIEKTDDKATLSIVMVGLQLWP